MVEYYIPLKSNIKLLVAKKRTAEKIKRVMVTIPMFNVLTIDLSNMNASILSITKEVMLYTPSGIFKMDKKEYNKKVLDTKLFRPVKESLFITL